jgi:hypothetical protein
MVSGHSPISHAVDDEVAAMQATCAVCMPWAEQDEGPYHRDAQHVRRDLIEDREGFALQLGTRLALDDDHARRHDPAQRSGTVMRSAASQGSHPPRLTARALSRGSADVTIRHHARGREAASASALAPRPP